ncbi:MULTISPECIES: ABC transporter substrate-binding protein [unclassified Diaminobutyricimonas]|uniref:ABC transporter substrate-binding protein n=1 Tax=unclassified Diaminobutyricimonas TaxID=2643261 RepID=UPI0012F4ED05|nr:MULTISPECIES: ABC transporter substrate-binding protein [unclassified Diaminobutyricimonas]
MRSTLRRRVIVPIAAAGAIGLVLAGCTGDQAAEGPADCGDYEDYGTFDGEEVSIYGTIVEVEQERLEESWADFASCTGIDIVYQGTQEFEAQVRVLVEGDNAPDLGIFPQPGLFATFAENLVAPPADVEANVDQYWSEDWKGFGTVDGTFLGAPLMASVKGLIWYSPSVWEENGWEIPETLDELTALSADIASEGTMKPWCAGFSSGEATGWPGTDWVEDMVLRLHGPDVYDQWVSHEIPFNDPRIVEAFDAVGDILKNPDYVNGGYGDVRSIVDITFNEGGWPVLDGECAMHHQASFYEGLWPEGTEVAEDGDVWAFITPGVEAGASDVTGGGEIVGAFTDSDAVKAVQTFMSTPEWANIRVEIGGTVSANNGVDPENASSPLLTAVIETLQDPETTFRFDASDLMPGAVGSDSFWKGIVAWIGGQDTQSTVDTIEASWPATP